MMNEMTKPIFVIRKSPQRMQPFSLEWISSGSCIRGEGGGGEEGRGGREGGIITKTIEFGLSGMKKLYCTVRCVYIYMYAYSGLTNSNTQGTKKALGLKD